MVFFPFQKQINGQRYQGKLIPIIGEREREISLAEETIFVRAVKVRKATNKFGKIYDWLEKNSSSSKLASPLLGRPTTLLSENRIFFRVN